MAGQFGNSPPQAGGSSTTAGAVTPPRPATPNAPIQIGSGTPLYMLADSFGTQDATKWGGWAPGVVDWVAPGRVQIQCATSYSNLYTPIAYDLRAPGGVFVQAVSTPNVGAGTTSMLLWVQADPANVLAMEWGNGNLLAMERLNNVETSTSIAYNPATMSYWRVAFDGVNVLWQYSADAVTWTTLRSKPPSFDISSVSVLLMSGYYGAETAPGTAVFDNLNVITRTASLSGSGALTASGALGFPGITYVAAGAVTSAAATSISPAMPAGIVANDILLAVLHSNDNVAVTPPTGWTVAGAVNAGTGSRTTVAWKRAAGGDVAQAFTKTGTVAFIGQVAAFRGVRVSGNPFAVTPPTTSKTTASTTFSLTGVTPTSTNNMIVACVGALIDAASTTNFAGWTSTGTGAMLEAFDNATATGLGGAVGLGYGRRALASTTGNVTGTMTSAVNGGVILALVPEPAPTAATTVTATTLSASQIQVAWSGGTTTGVTYTVESAPLSTGPWVTVASGLSASPYTHAGLNSGTTYWYRVTTIVAASGEATSASTSATTTALPKISTLTDDFATADAAKWGGIDGTSILIDTGRLRVNTTSGYPNAYTVNRYDLRDSITTIEIAQTPNVGNGGTAAYFIAEASTGNKVSIYWANGNLIASYHINGVENYTFTTYLPVPHRIWRIRESGGMLYWETSATGLTWANIRAPVATPLSLSNIAVIFQSGYSGTEPSPGAVIFDNFNATYSDPPPNPRTIYVDPAGSDSNDGLSSGTAWATVAKVTNTLLYAGDQVLFKRGSTWTGHLVVTGSGTATSPITVGAYGTGAQPIITGGGSSGVAGSVDPCEIYGSFVVIDGIELRGAALNNAYFYGADCTIQNCTVRWGSFGVKQDWTAARLKVLHNNVVDVNVGITPPGTDDDAGASAIILSGDGAEVAYNTSSGCWYVSPDYGLDGCFVEVWGATNAVVHHNIGSESVAFSELGNTATSNITYHHNVFSSTLYPASGFVIHGDLYNATTDDPFGPVLGTKVYHNTMVLSGGTTADSNGIWVGLNGEADVQNNVFVTAGPPAVIVNLSDTNRVITEGGNVFWGGVGNNNVHFPSGSLDASSVIADPLFVSSTDFRLQRGSPGIDLGADLGYATDFAGNPRISGAAPDAGAYEIAPAVADASLTVTAAPSAAGARTVTADASLTVTETSTAAVARAAVAAASLTATGTTAPTATIARLAVASLTATETAAPTAVQTQTGNAAGATTATATTTAARAVTAGAALTVTPAVTAAAATAQPASSLTETFAVADPSKWTYPAGTSVVAGQLRIVPTTGYPAISSVASYSLRNSAVSVEVPGTFTTSPGTSNEQFLQFADAAGNYLGIFIAGGNLAGRSRTAAGNVNDDAGWTTYNSTTMRYWRIRHDGTNVQYEYSADRSTWTILRTLTTWATNIDSAQIVLTGGYYNGADTAAGTALFDNVNSGDQPPGQYGVTAYGQSSYASPSTGADATGTVAAGSSASATVVRAGAAALTETASSSSTGDRAASATSTSSVTGTSTATGAASVAVTAQITETASSTATAARTVTGDASLAVAANNISAGARTVTADATLAGTASSSAGGARTVVGDAALAVTSTSSTSATRAAAGDAALAETATSTSTGTHTAAADAALTETATGTATGARTVTAAASLTATETSTASSSSALLVTADATLPVTATGTATGTHTAAAAAALTATVTGAATGVRDVTAASTLPTVASTTTSSTRTVTADATATGTATGTASSSRTVTADSSAAETATGAASAVRAATGDATLTVTETSTGSSSATRGGDAALAATATSTASSIPGTVASAALAVTAGLSASATVAHAGDASQALTAAPAASAARAVTAASSGSLTAGLTGAVDRALAADAALPVTGTCAAAPGRAGTADASCALAVTSTGVGSRTAVTVGLLSLAAAFDAAVTVGVQGRTFELYTDSDDNITGSLLVGVGPSALTVEVR